MSLGKKLLSESCPMEIIDNAGLHSRISEQAKNIASLAEQTTDRRIKLHLIGVALGLLDMVEKCSNKAEISGRIT